MTFKKTQIAVCLLFSLLAFVGCSEKTEDNGSSGAASMQSVDTTTPISEIQAGAETMGSEDLQAAAVKYKEAILDKKNEIKDMVTKIKEIPLAEVLGKEAQTLKTEAKNLESSLTELTTRFQVYYGALKDKGASLSGLEL
jgi:hypothetical protein